MATRNDMLLELEARNAIDHQPTDAVMTVIDMDLIAKSAQPLGSCQTRRTGPDDTDALRPFLQRLTRLDPSFFEGGFGNEFLDRPDRDALEILLDDAIAFAQAILRADPAADFGKGIGRRGQSVRLFQPVFSSELQPVRDVVAQRAMDGAERHTALRTATRLLLGVIDRKSAVDLSEILASFRGRALFRHLLRH